MISTPYQPAGKWSDPYSFALQNLGETDIPGKSDLSLIARTIRRAAAWMSDDMEATWCAVFVQAMAKLAGYERTGALSARAWLNVGEPVVLHDLRKGDVVVLWTGFKSVWTGHVAFLDHYNPTRELLYLLGCNQDREINISSYASNQFLGARRLRSLDSLQGNSQNRII